MLTLDIDRAEVNYLYYVLKRLLNIGLGDYECVVRASSSRRGYHVIVYGFDKNVKAIRKLYDDTQRIYYDEINEMLGKTTQVLFTQKGHRKAVELYRGKLRDIIVQVKAKHSL